MGTSSGAYELNHECAKNQYLTSDIELIIKYRVIWIPSVLVVYFRS